MKTFAIISHDRHRDDYVYIIKCKEKDIEKYISHIWDKDFSWKAPIKDKECYWDGSGDYKVEVAILKTIDVTQ